MKRTTLLILITILSVNLQAATLFSWNGERYFNVLSGEDLKVERKKAVMQSEPCLAGIDSALRKSLCPVIVDYSITYKLPVTVIDAVILCESAYNKDAISRAGAIGLMQLMPTTALELDANPYVVEENLHGGIKYLSNLHSKFNKWEIVWAAYNAGPGAVRKYSGVPPYKETIQYIAKLQKTVNYLKKNGSCENLTSTQ